MSGNRNRWIGLGMLSLGVSMIIVDVSIVNVAIPVIIEDLGIDFTAAEWVNTVYSLVFAALLVTLGRLGDLLGRRKVFLGGLVVFAGASLFAGLAPTGGLLIVARLLQGIGGASILPATLSLVTSAIRGGTFGMGHRADAIRTGRLVGAGVAATSRGRRSARCKLSATCGSVPLRRLLRAVL